MGPSCQLATSRLHGRLVGLAAGALAAAAKVAAAGSKAAKGHLQASTTAGRARSDP